MSNKKTVPIFFAVDDNYAPFLFVAIESIVAAASRSYEYNIHILCENLNERNRAGLLRYGRDNFHIFITDMTEVIAAKANALHTRDYYSKTTYFRMYISAMFPEYDKALYLDSDIVLNADVSELYNFDLGASYVGAVTCEAVNSVPVYTRYAEEFMGFTMPWYFNAGVLVMNLKALRSSDFENRFFELLGKVKFEVIQDEDYLNVLCREHVLFLPRVWNKIPLPTDGIDENNVKLVHYNLTFRPWRYDGVLFGDLFWRHAKNTEVYGQLLSMKANFSAADAAYDEKWSVGLQKMAREHAERPMTFKRQIGTGAVKLDWYAPRDAYDDKYPTRIPGTEDTRVSELIRSDI